MLKKKKDFELRTTQIIGLGFLIMIFIGSLLLALPIASASGKATPYMDALFTATTSSCVTGLVTVVTGQHWSFFGQLIILIMIQLGGLGVVSFTTLLLIFSGKRIQLKQRLLIQEAYGFDTLTGLVKMVKKMVKGALIVEGIGALFYMIIFIPRYGILKGVWNSVFMAVSAFCNAGMDLMGPDSLMGYVEHPLMNIVTMALIILGGIGFIVWWDVIDMVKRIRHEKMGFQMAWKRMSLHSKLVLSVTGILILGGTVLFFVLEYNNPQTLGSLSLGGKIWASLFQSVTLRTAGFASINQAGLTTASALTGCVFMFIGGSPGGTAGGVKTTTMALLVFAVLSMIRGKTDVELGRRRIDMTNIMKGLCVALLQVAFLMISTFALCCQETQASLMEIMYEVFSALGTVGLTMGITENLTFLGKIVIVLSMYFGRLGPITVAMILNKPENKKLLHRKFPEGKIYV